MRRGGGCAVWAGDGRSVRHNDARHSGESLPSLCGRPQHGDEQQRDERAADELCDEVEPYPPVRAIEGLEGRVFDAPQTVRPGHRASRGVYEKTCGTREKMLADTAVWVNAQSPATASTTRRRRWWKKGRENERGDARHAIWGCQGCQDHSVRNRQGAHAGASKTRPPFTASQSHAPRRLRTPPRRRSARRMRKAPLPLRMPVAMRQAM